MRFKFETSKVSRLASHIIMDDIVSQLLKQDYLIVDRTDSVLTFRDNNWQIRSKSEFLKRIDRGKFEIEVQENGVCIKFSYYISFLTEFIISLIITIISILQSYFILFIALFFLLQLVVRIYMLKQVSREIIADIGN